MEKIDEVETSRFEDCKKDATSFDQDSVKRGDCYFSLPQPPQGQPFSENQPPGVFCKKKLFLRNFTIFIGNHLC